MAYRKWEQEQFEVMSKIDFIEGWEENKTRIQKELNSILIPLLLPCKWYYGSPFSMILSFPIYTLELYSANLIDPIGPLLREKTKLIMWLCSGIVEKVTPNIVSWRQLSALKTTLLQLEIWWLQYLSEIFLVGLLPTMLIAWQPLVENVHRRKICQTSIHLQYACMHTCGICKFVMELMIRPTRAKGLDNSWERLYVEMVICISIFGPPYRNMCLLPLWKFRLSSVFPCAFKALLSMVLFVCCW